MANIFPKVGLAKNQKKRSTIGIDADEKSVKLVEIRRSPIGPVLSKYAIAEVAIAEGLDKTMAISSAIKKLIADNSIEAGEVYAAVSGPGVSIRRITVPEMPEEELYGAVRWEAKNLIPFPLDAVTIDYYIIGKVTDKGSEKLDVIVVAAQDEVINQQVRIIEGAGLKVAGITANPFAIWDVLKRSAAPKEEEVVAVIDIGAGAASINLFKNNVLQFTREISVAGESITKAMTGVLISDQWQLSLTYEQAEKIKITHGIPKEDSQDKTSEGIPLSQILEVMKPTLRRMLNEILRSFDYYKEQFREPKINKVYLAGGSSKLKNLEEYLTTGLGIKVEVANPLSGLNIELADKASADELREVAPRLTLSLGLALGEAKRLNLVHVKKPAKKGVEFDKFFEAIPIPSNVWTLAVVLILVIAVAQNVYLAKMVGHFRSELESKRAILTDLRSLADRREIINKISMEETRVRDILEQLNLTIPSGITLTQLTYLNASRYMSVAGEAGNTKLVGKFLRMLEDSANFSRATLVESHSAGEGGAMAFRMSLKVD
jgi:type IV pilus assembly protein PilM